MSSADTCPHGFFLVPELCCPDCRPAPVQVPPNGSGNGCIANEAASAMETELAAESPVPKKRAPRARKKATP